MMVILAIVFIGALAGLIKPFLGNLTRKHFGAIAIGSFVCMMIAVGESQSPNNASDVAAPNSSVEEKVAASNTDTPSDPIGGNASKWQYSTDKDEMRGTTTKLATLLSENEVDLDFPYGEQRGTILVRTNSDGLNVMFAVGSGQILCNSFSRSSLSVKFDDGPVRKFNCTDASDGSNDTAFFTNETAILSGLRKARRTIIEAEFYQKGPQQFVFKTDGLQWK
ncbi:hypothetical protein ACVOMT_11755 [Sphingomonas panni]